jgi:SAM-dependent methyltransferase
MDRQIYDRMRDLEQAHWWFTARREILASEISRLPLPAKAEVLEVGCGTGGNLDMLSRFGRVRGIEPDSESRDYAAKRTGVAISPGALPDRLPDFGTAFDLVTAFDVVEHVDDDGGTVEALGRLLAPGGFLVTTVPAHQWMWSAHDEHHHHKRRYSLRAYRALFDAAGLRLRRATYFNCLLFPPIAAVRLLRIATGSKRGSDEAEVGAPLNRVLHGLFASEQVLLRHMNLPFGVSILAVADRAP